MKTLQPQSYVAAARRLRESADILERLAQPTTPRDQKALTQRLGWLRRYTEILYQRHARALDGRC